MSPLLSILICAGATLALGAPLLAAPPAKGFDAAYGVLKTRNIFDPQRQPGAIATAPVASAPPVTQADYAALTGIMVTKEKVLAFFSGSRPEFNAVLAPKGIIAGAEIKNISPDFIQVDRNGKTIAISVGQTVPLDANSVPGPAPTPATPDPAASPLAASSPGSTDSASAAPAAPAASSGTNSATPASAVPASSPSAPAGLGREALMRRMMEKRQQDLR